MANDTPAPTWDSLETFARTKIQQFIQALRRPQSSHHPAIRRLPWGSTALVFLVVGLREVMNADRHGIFMLWLAYAFAFGLARLVLEASGSVPFGLRDPVPPDVATASFAEFIRWSALIVLFTLVVLTRVVVAVMWTSVQDATVRKRWMDTLFLIFVYAVPAMLFYNYLPAIRRISPLVLYQQLRRASVAASRHGREAPPDALHEFPAPNSLLVAHCSQ